ncbi:MAG: type II toxin-antitoxin system prevent-host-death family antitoxin [Cyanobacteria bacterium K_Offshore_surface_m2_239]|nr:type II toxin-antitoxin system prevent-host-death family antitoxin [Cyanobacteria bacterium K_Offshore_surface_m2_239]
MAAEWTLQDAKNRFSAVVEAALAGEHQRVTRRGQWVGVVLSAAEYGCVASIRPVPPRCRSCCWRCRRTTNRSSGSG